MNHYLNLEFDTAGSSNKHSSGHKKHENLQVNAALQDDEQNIDPIQSRMIALRELARTQSIKRARPQKLQKSFCFF